MRDGNGYAWFTNEMMTGFIWIWIVKQIFRNIVSSLERTNHVKIWTQAETISAVRSFYPMVFQEIIISRNNFPIGVIWTKCHLNIKSKVSISDSKKITLQIRRS